MRADYRRYGPMKCLLNVGRCGCCRCAVLALPFWREPPGGRATGKGPVRQQAAARGAPAKSYGFYSKGCFSGGVAIPTDGPTWQAMRLSRNRRWGHPDDDRADRKAVARRGADGWPGLLLGDISQPRGGPMLTGHASHQIGLDADIWFTPMPDRRLSLPSARTCAPSCWSTGRATVIEPAGRRRICAC